MVTSYNIGQVVIVTVQGRHGNPTLNFIGNVSKITPTGRVTVALASDLERTFGPDGLEIVKKKSWSAPVSMRAMQDGESAEKINEQRKAITAAIDAKAEQKRAEQAAAVQAWWDAEGKAMWDARIEMPDSFLSVKPCVIKFTCRGELHLSFVVISTRESFDGPEVEVLSGGLIGKAYEFNGKARESINTYSHSNHTGKTLMDALYDVCN